MLLSNTGKLRLVRDALERHGFTNFGIELTDARLPADISEKPRVCPIKEDGRHFAVALYTDMWVLFEYQDAHDRYHNKTGNSNGTVRGFGVIH